MVSTFDLITYIGLGTIIEFEKWFCIRPCFEMNAYPLFLAKWPDKNVLNGRFEDILECPQRNWMDHEEQIVFVTTKLDSRWQQEFLFSVKIVLSRPFVTLFVSWRSLASDWSLKSDTDFSLVNTNHCRTNPNLLWLESANESDKRNDVPIYNARQIIAHTFIEIMNVMNKVMKKYKKTSSKVFSLANVFRFGHTMIPPGIYRRRLSSKTEGKCEFVPARNGGKNSFSSTLAYFSTCQGRLCVCAARGGMRRGSWPRRVWTRSCWAWAPRSARGRTPSSAPTSGTTCLVQWSSPGMM